MHWANHQILWIRCGTDQFQYGSVYRYDMLFEFVQPMHKAEILFRMRNKAALRLFTLFDDWRTALEKLQSIKNVLDPRHLQPLRKFPTLTRFRCITYRVLCILHHMFIYKYFHWHRGYFGMRYNYVYRTICWFDAYTKSDNKGVRNNDYEINVIASRGCRPTHNECCIIWESWSWYAVFVELPH